MTLEEGKDGKRWRTVLITLFGVIEPFTKRETNLMFRSTEWWFTRPYYRKGTGLRESTITPELEP